MRIDIVQGVCGLLTAEGTILRGSDLSNSIQELIPSSRSRTPNLNKINKKSTEDILMPSLTLTLLISIKLSFNKVFQVHLVNS